MKPIFNHIIKYWLLYSLLAAGIGTYASFMVFKAQAEEGLGELPKIKADIEDLKLRNATITTEITSINKGVTRIEGKLDQLLQNLIKK